MTKAFIGLSMMCALLRAMFLIYDRFSVCKGMGKCSFYDVHSYKIVCFSAQRLAFNGFRTSDGPSTCI